MAKPQKRRIDLNRSERNDDSEPLIVSWSALQEYLSSAPKLVRLIECSERDKGKLLKLLGEVSIPVVTQSELKEGFCAKVVVDWCHEADFYTELEGRESDIIVACDHVTDTRNMGAIARTAAYFGVRNLILPKDRQAPINSTTLSAAQGAFALLRPVMVTNLGRSLERLKKLGYWVISADMEGKPTSSLPAGLSKIVLVLGSEDLGVSHNVSKKADFIVGIHAPRRCLDSLNVSVASGILLHDLSQRIK